jgi:hypothetical protein
MLATNDLNITGRLTLRKTTLDGVLAEEVMVSNDITLAGRELVAKLFGLEKDVGQVKRVSLIQLGKGSEKTDPKSTTKLGSKVGQTAITKVEQLPAADPDGTPRVLLRLTGELGEDDCNDELREAGLFTADEVMYNRVVFPTITKSSHFKLTLVWEITF